jgi:alpha-mannosidase
MADKTNKIFMIGNAHIDPVWLWQWQDGFHETHATFRSALDRMQEDAEFVFTASQAALYEWIEQSDPDMFGEIRQRVAEGRWKLAGGWWVEPDCNIPAGESFVRQGLYGQRYFKEKFGVTCKVGYCVDSFGHNGMLPQILKKSGMPYYVFMRPSPYEKELPGRIFWWEADDGSRVLAFRIAYSYASWGGDLKDDVHTLVAGELKAPGEALMFFYGVGDHGGGPTRENIASIRQMQADHDLPELVFAGPEEFFAAIEKPAVDYPHVHDDLQHHSRGCYSAHSGAKRWNRLAENRLLAAEKWASVARQVTGLAYPTDLGRAWKNVLFNQFHDNLAGTCLEEAYTDTREQSGEALAIAGRALNQAVQGLAWKINVAAQEGTNPEAMGLTPVVVFNPHAWKVKANVEVDVPMLDGSEALLDENGQQSPMQRVQPRATSGWIDRLSFMAELPPLGYRLYRIAPLPPQTGKMEFAAQPALRAGPHSLENARYRLEINPASGSAQGAVRSLWDKQAGCEVFNGEAAAALVLDDPSDTWSHDVLAFNTVAGQFIARQVELVESGPVKATLRVTSEYNRSTLVQDFSLYSEMEGIAVRVSVDWHEQQKMLKLRFPVNVTQGQATYEIPYGHIQRPANGEEQPGQSWIDLSGLPPEGVSPETGQRVGVSLLNDGKYSYDVTGSSLGLTVLRSPIYAHHHPAMPEPGKRYAYIDQGEQVFHYTILPHRGDWAEAGTVRRAAELNQPPVILATTFHAGPLPPSASFAAVEPENVVISVIKQAEDDQGLIVRAYETAGRATAARFHLTAWGRDFTAQFGACEIKTFHIPQQADKPVVETDLIEWE